MLFYFILIIIMYILFTLADFDWHNKQKKNILLMLPCIILFFVAAFRFDVGYDYIAYYKLLVPYYDYNNISRFEPLSKLIMNMAYNINMPFMLFVFFAIVTYIPVFYFCYKSKSFQIAFWIYVFIFLLTSFGVIRQAAAMSIYACAILYMKERSFWKYLIFCILASLFHSSALIMIPVYFIFHRCSLKLILSIMIFLTISIQVIFTFMIELNYYSSYLLKEELGGGSLIRFFHIGLYILLLCLAYKTDSFAYLKNYFSAILPALFLPFLFGGHLGGRLSMYFYLMYIILIPEILYQYGKKFRMLFMLMLCCYFSMELYMSQTNPTKSPYTPYKTIFDVDLEHPKFK